MFVLIVQKGGNSFTNSVGSLERNPFRFKEGILLMEIPSEMAEIILLFLKGVTARDLGIE